MNWIQLDSEEILKDLIKRSYEKCVFIFIFSPGEVVSIIVRNLLEREWSSGEMNMDTFFLDSQKSPELVKKIADDFSAGIITPIALVIEEGKCKFSAVNGKITFGNFRKFSNPKN